MSKPMRILRFASASLVVGLMVLELPGKAEISTLDSTRNDYRTCAATLLRLKVSTEETATVCGRAFKPEDLSVCVERTVERGNVPLPNSLAACRDVRQPVQMADCVVDIRRQLTDTDALDVLDRCRRSLLPERYANCVIGINPPINTPSSTKLSSCLDAGQLAQELDPSLILYNRPQGSQLPPVPSDTVIPNPNISPNPSVSPSVQPSPIPTPPSTSPSP